MKPVISLLVIGSTLSFIGCGGGDSEDVFHGNHVPANTVVTSFPEFTPYQYSGFQNIEASDDSIKGTWLLLAEGVDKYDSTELPFYARALFKISDKEENTCFSKDMDVYTLSAPIFKGITLNIIDNTYMASVTGEESGGNLVSWNFQARKISDDANHSLVVEQLEIERDNISTVKSFGNCVIESVGGVQGEEVVIYKLEVNGKIEGINENRRFEFTFDPRDNSIRSNGVEIFYNNAGERELFWPSFNSRSDYLTFNPASDEHLFSLTTSLESPENGQFHSSIRSIRLPD